MPLARRDASRDRKLLHRSRWLRSLCERLHRHEDSHTLTNRFTTRAGSKTATGLRIHAGPSTGTPQAPGPCCEAGGEVAAAYGSLVDLAQAAQLRRAPCSLVPGVQATLQQAQPALERQLISQGPVT